MITECMNPSCRKELRYLREGRVVRVVKSNRDPINVEHFWLCGNCHLAFDFEFSQQGDVSVVPRAATAAPLPPRAVPRPRVLTLVA
jgi:hypothetical protein